MAGLLDWLSDALGGAGQAATDPSTMGAVSSAGTPPVAMPATPPVAPPTGSDAQALANPSGPQAPPTGDTPPAFPMPQGPDSPQNPTGGAVPMPMARPPGANATPPMAPPTGAPAPSAMPASTPPTAPMAGALPPGATPTEGAGMAPTGARGILDRALGIDPNSKRSLIGGLGAGLTAAGNSAGKSKFQAFAGGAGAALEGGEKADDKTTANQQKHLTQAIEAMKAGDSRQANLALTQLRQAQTQMTLQGKGGKDSVVNSDQQLYLRAQGATNQDANLKILKSQYDKIAMERGASSPEAKAAMDAYQKTYDETLNGHLGRLGLDPKTASKIGKQPGMTQDNPVDKGKMTSQEAFDKLPPGSWFVNPKDGKILQKPMTPVQAPGQQPAAGAPAPGGQNLPAGQGGTPAAPPASNLPPLPPTTPQASSIPGLGADEDADEKEPA